MSLFFFFYLEAHRQNMKYEGKGETDSPFSDNHTVNLFSFNAWQND